MPFELSPPKPMLRLVISDTPKAASALTSAKSVDVIYNLFRRFIFYLFVDKFFDRIPIRLRTNSFNLTSNKILARFFCWIIIKHAKAIFVYHQKTPIIMFYSIVTFFVRMNQRLVYN